MKHHLFHTCFSELWNCRGNSRNSGIFLGEKEAKIALFSAHEFREEDYEETVPQRLKR